MNAKTIIFSLFALFGFVNNVFAAPLCALVPAGHDPTQDQSPAQFAAQQMHAVDSFLCQRFGCPSYGFRQNHTIHNALASTDQTGNTIRYNSGFMNHALTSFGNSATLGILAHELGHIIDFANNPLPVPQAQREATADRYSGCVFALAGRPVSDLLGLAQTLHAMGMSPGYPTPTQRVRLIQIGYNQCLHN